MGAVLSQWMKGFVYVCKASIGGDTTNIVGRLGDVGESRNGRHDGGSGSETWKSGSIEDELSKYGLLGWVDGECRAGVGGTEAVF